MNLENLTNIHTLVCLQRGQNTKISVQVRLGHERWNGCLVTELHVSLPHLFSNFVGFRLHGFVLLL